MKINEIKEVGFYHEVNDLERKVIYEVMENADDDWLKEDPKATLLIDTWHYEYKDESDRARYSVDGNLLTLYLNESDIDVVKIEDTKYKVFGEMGQFLIEDKPTYKELFKHKEKECKELKKELDKEHLLMLEKQDKATRYFLVLNGIKEYIYNNTNFDVNDSIQSKTSGYDILQIIEDV